MVEDTAPGNASLAELLDTLCLVAVEHEDALSLTALVNYIDLYRHHLLLAGVAARSFDVFVRDASLLAAAAVAAEHDSGIPTPAPPPLG